jgi:hypothetical protein
VDPYWIRIRIGIQPKMLDPDQDEMNADPQPCFLPVLRIWDPVIFCPLDLGYGIDFFLDPGSSTHIYESLVTIFWVKSTVVHC